MADKNVILAAGAVAWRQGPSALEVLLAHRQKYDDWTLPKGKREPGEHLTLNAVREVREETGATVTLGRRLRGTRYPYRSGTKEVDYWAGRIVADQSGAVPNDEVDQVQWLPVSEAIELVTYDHDASVLRDFDRKPADTVPLIVVRHASAGSKKDWPGEDNDRPLDPPGGLDAQRLAELLTCFAPGPARVLSSSALRCVDTVRPYATLAAAGVEVSDALHITAGAGLRAPLIHDLVADGKPAVLCAHRENVSAIVAEACAALDARPPGDLSLPKAGFWVLNIAAGALTSADHYSV
jgi:phosphohistidine phosphatase SixA/8-oxo-dGTP pyrophosphatase MutT (NUDIX family)